MRVGLARWAAWFVGFFAIAAGWAMLTPIDQYPDEGPHVYRAVFVWEGATPTNGAYTHGTGAAAPVPASLHDLFTPGVACKGLASATQCAVIPGDPTRVNMVSSEGRMFPLYYALVGWPLAIWPDRRGVQAARVVSAGLSAALLASAAVVLLSLARRRRVIPLAGLFAGLTPLALYLTGGVNPSSMELAGAVLFWAATLALVRGSPTRFFAVAGGIALVTARISGPVWVAIALGLALLTVSPSAWWPFVRRHGLPVLLPIVAVGAVVVAWLLVFHSYEVFASVEPIKASHREIVVNTLSNMDDIHKQEVGFFGWLTIPPPWLALICWILIGVLAVVLAFLGGRRAGSVTLLGVALLLVIPFAAQVSSYSRSGLGGWQGRYMLPLVVGVPLLAVIPGAAARLERRSAVVIAWAMLALAAIGQVRSVYRVARVWWVQFPEHHAGLATGVVAVAVGGLILAALVLAGARPGSAAAARSGPEAGSRPDSEADSPVARARGDADEAATAFPKELAGPGGQ